MSKLPRRYRISTQTVIHAWRDVSIARRWSVGGLSKALLLLALTSSIAIDRRVVAAARRRRHRKSRDSAVRRTCAVVVRCCPFAQTSLQKHTHTCWVKMGYDFCGGGRSEFSDKSESKRQYSGHLPICDIIDRKHNHFMILQRRKYSENVHHELFKTQILPNLYRLLKTDGLNATMTSHVSDRESRNVTEPEQFVLVVSLCPKSSVKCMTRIFLIFIAHGRVLLWLRVAEKWNNWRWGRGA